MRRLSADADILEVDNHPVCGANALTGWRRCAAVVIRADHRTPTGWSQARAIMTT